MLALDEYVCIKGKNFNKTKDIKVLDLKYFIERDIFLAIKSGEVPEIEFDISIFAPDYSSNQGHIEIEIHNVFDELIIDESIVFLDLKYKELLSLSSLGQSLVDTLSTIVSSYNHLVITFSDFERKDFFGKFSLEINFHEDLIQEQLQRQTVLLFSA